MSEVPLVPAGLEVCVIGYGVAGHLHESLMRDWGARVSVVEAGSVADPPARLWSSLDRLPWPDRVDVWSVCTPTDAHLSTVRAILGRCPDARLIVEKPLCRPGELEEFAALLSAHPSARLVLVDHYRYAAAPKALSRLRAETVGYAPVSAVRVSFTKDRRADAATGRFVDRAFGVFGYEWLHMIACLRGALSPAQFAEYLATPVDDCELRVGTDEDLVPNAARETTRLSDGCEVDLFSTVVGAAPGGPVPPAWVADHGVGPGGRQRLLQVESAATLFTVEFDPVADPVGQSLGRNVHRLSVRRGGHRSRWIVHDSPMGTALASALATLSARRGDFDPRPMHRLRALAERAVAVAAAAAHPVQEPA
ncbi:Gfo/Idh/MocA family oxidoreductase [Amycolatopsis sp. PS_44_ISF1]|uniref:Gfo/Idh/MocA family oxidoreductase n=1 Tax=Amycolatopsis sp. PS_44_ISF1 TaxID=2974917 RepID=UPI0028DE773F|nr:Gfo/Idh/MocA family oxidoreductase [Amycolatopsis sp. PS_44_ISF1]MDT8913515.1 Gfo/Idh/MocA family oxidoreductase [Amycolatopsis sp. PS_44_ISF1]